MIRSTSRRIAVGTGMAALIAALGASPAAAGILFGGTGPSECYGALSVQTVEAGSSSVSTRGKTTTITCTDGDPCDAGACGDKACTFPVAGCINQPGLAGCTPPAALQQFRVRGKVSVPAPSSLQGSACGAFVDVSVQTKKKKKGDKPGKVTLNVLAKAPKGTRPRADTDTFQFVCQPRTTACPPPTTTTTTTPTTTTTTIPGVPLDLDFVVTTPGGTCGDIRGTDDGVIRNLTCGGLNIGGGQSTVLEGPVPAGSISRFRVQCPNGDAECPDSTCTIGPVPAASGLVDCSDTGCRFGTPLPIENGGLSTCVLNTFAAPVSGTMNLSTGTTENLAVSLNSEIYLVGGTYGDTLCPPCVDGSGNPVNGSPEAPATGTCLNGRNEDQACTSTNPQGLTKDCLPGKQPCDPVTGECADGVLALGSIPVNLTPLGTGTVTLADQAGRMCSSVGQSAATQGCFGSSVTSRENKLCAKITEQGEPAGRICKNDPRPVKLASVFCIPATSSSLVNGAANLPGPGATTLVGTLTLRTPTP